MDHCINLRALPCSLAADKHHCTWEASSKAPSYRQHRFGPSTIRAITCSDYRPSRFFQQPCRTAYRSVSGSPWRLLVQRLWSCRLECQHICWVPCTCWRVCLRFGRLECPCSLLAWGHLGMIRGWQPWSRLALNNQRWSLEPQCWLSCSAVRPTGGRNRPSSP